MIRFLKRRVWPWSEIERLSKRADVLELRLNVRSAQCDALMGDMANYVSRYSRLCDEDGRFMSSD